jgi:hypothetical protein
MRTKAGFISTTAIGLLGALAACSGAPDSESEEPSPAQIGATAAALTSTSDAVNVCATPVCPTSGYAPANCHNADSPPPPSILRSLDQASWREGHVSTKGGGATPAPPGTWSMINQAAVPWPPYGFEEWRPTSGMVQVLPNQRGTNDGRVAWFGRFPTAQLSLFSPENLTYDHRRRDDADATAGSSVGNHNVAWQGQSDFPFFVLLDPRSGVSALPLDTYADVPSFGHGLICDESGTGSAAAPRNPRIGGCSAMYGAIEEQGDCYDVTLMANVTQSDTLTGKWEMVSNDVTIFVPRAKRQDLGASTHVTVYPSSVANQHPLPDANAYNPWSTSGPGGGVGYKGSWSTFQSQAAQCGTATAPAWCAFFASQKRRSVIGIFDPAKSRKMNWDLASASEKASGPAGNFVFNWLNPGPDIVSSDAPPSMFEPAMTADGRLLVVNMNSYPGLMYSHNTAANACDVSGFDKFSFLSHAPFDASMKDTYDLARSGAFRDSNGDVIGDGAIIPGAYTWLDRAGKNIFFSTINDGKDAYHTSATWAPPLGTGPSAGQGNNLVDQRPGKGVVALGAWTRGKMVVLDNGLNFSDFGGVEGSAPDERSLMRFGMDLYQGGPTEIYTRSSRSLFSFENRLFHYDALTPTLPADVVWTLSSDTQRNAEVAFDDYVNERALIVAHMNSPTYVAKRLDGSDVLGWQPPEDPLITFSNGVLQPAFAPSFQRWQYNDGLLPVHPSSVRFPPAPASGNTADYYTAVSPRLQNSATAGLYKSAAFPSPPRNLVLHGGARVEPVALGGVLGKGVYLDGINDYADARFAMPYQQDWYVGAWFDSREPSASMIRTLFAFPDGSWIGMSRNELRIYNGITGVQSSLPITTFGVTTGKFVHVGVKIVTQAGVRTLAFFLDGTRMGSPLPGGTSAATYGFQLSTITPNNPPPTQVSKFGLASLGSPATPPPFLGWVDELKVIALQASELPLGSHFDEIACNHALGTLVDVGEGDPGSATGLGRLANLGRAAGLLPSVSIIGPHKEVHAWVCEQLDLVSFIGPSDLAPQAASGAVCVNRVHKNPGPIDADRCIRKQVLGLTDPGKVVVPTSPLPDFTTTPFCLSCHNSSHDLDTPHVAGLSVSAPLAAGLPSVLSMHDIRRRPMQWIQTHTGKVPSKQGWSGAPQGTLPTNLGAGQSFNVDEKLPERIAPF